MTDLEIGARIAEIVDYKGWFKMSTRGIRGVFNPLANDALAFQLLIEFGITFDFYTDDDGDKVFYGYIEDENDNLITIPDCKCLKRFICLSIIELHKETK